MTPLLRMGGIPAVNGRGERLLLHIGIIDILQSYRWVTAPHPAGLVHAPGPTSPLPSESLVRDRSGLAQDRVESGVLLADSGPCYVPRLGYLISCWCLPPSVEQSKQLSKQWVRVSMETRVGQGGQDSPGRAARARPRAGMCIEDILPPTPQRRLGGCLEAAMCSPAQVWYGSLAEALGAPSIREETGSACLGQGSKEGRALTPMEGHAPQPFHFLLQSSSNGSSQPVGRGQGAWKEQGGL